MMAGDDASFTWRVEGNPLPRVTWLKDGERLNAGDARAVTSRLGGELHFKNTATKASGDYTLVAYNNVTDMGQNVILEVRQSVHLLVVGKFFRLQL